MKRGTPDHPKTLSLMRRLSCSRFEAIGILETLWHWTARFAPQGDIGRWSDGEIEAGLGWQTTGMLIPALVACRWLDTDPVHRLLVHDWSQHADEATKKALHRAALPFVQPSAAGVQTDGGQNLPAVALPCPALPCPAKPEPQSAPPSAPLSAAPEVKAEFWRAVWTAWCRKRGGNGREPDTVEFALGTRWFETKVPLRIVLRGIEDCSSKNLTPAKRLTYVGPAVDQAIAHWRRSATS